MNRRSINIFKVENVGVIAESEDLPVFMPDHSNIVTKTIEINDKLYLVTSIQEHYKFDVNLVQVIHTLVYIDESKPHNIHLVDSVRI